MSNFKFALGDTVKLSLSSENGTVIGRAEYQTLPASYWVRYVAADGRQVEDWFYEDALQ